MSNVINKAFIAALLAAISLTSCGDKEKEGAQQLYAEGKAALEAHNYQGVLTLLDTLNSRYPKQLDVRRTALRLRAAAMEGLAVDSISAGDAALAQATINLDAIRPGFRHVDSSVGLDGYFLPKGVSDKVMTTTGIQARVSDKGFFYIVANVQGRAIGLRAIEFTDGAERISSSEISPARIVKVEGSESASFNPEDLEGIGAWLEGHQGANNIILVGSKGKANVKMNDKMRRELIDCYRFSCALQAQRLASLKREKYERMLATARDQLANLPVEGSDEQ